MENSVSANLTSHRFLDSASGLARNDTFECHPDRGPNGPERRDLWTRRERITTHPASE